MISINRVIIRVGSDIQAYSHIDALLLKDRLEVGIGQCSRSHWGLLGLEASKLQHTAPHSKQILVRQLMQP
jgi:hypothetical protein